MSFQQGLSGLNGASKNLDVIGHNIANVATVGFKQSRAEFADIYANALGGGSMNIGIGVQLQAVAQQFSQGNLNPTGNPLDVAISGGGFFQLRDRNGSTVYGRNGQFKLDNDGYIINNDGMNLLGFGVDASGNLKTGIPDPLRLPTAGIKPNPSTKIDLELNLDARWPVKDPGVGVIPRINFTDSSTYNQATSIATFDSLGKPVNVTFYFQKSATNNQMEVYATADGVTVGGSPSDPQPVTTLSFNANGSLATSTNPTLGLQALVPTMNNLTLSFTGTSQYGSAYSITNQHQDGFTAGSLNSIVIEQNGTITGRYSNGQSRVAGQVQTALFRNPQGLEPAGGNVWLPTTKAGTPITGLPGSGNLGILRAGMLEDSNVDLTGELVNMITAQRNYQANAQTIKTADQVMQTLVNLR